MRLYKLIEGQLNVDSVFFKQELYQSFNVCLAIIETRNKKILQDEFVEAIKKVRRHLVNNKDAMRIISNHNDIEAYIDATFSADDILFLKFNKTEFKKNELKEKLYELTVKDEALSGVKIKNMERLKKYPCDLEIILTQAYTFFFKIGINLTPIIHDRGGCYKNFGHEERFTGSGSLILSLYLKYFSAFSENDFPKKISAHYYRKVIPRT